MSFSMPLVMLFSEYLCLIDMKKGNVYKRVTSPFCVRFYVLWVFYGLLVQTTRRQSSLNQRKYLPWRPFVYSLSSFRFTAKNTFLVVPEWKNWLLVQSEIKVRAVNIFTLPEASKWWDKKFITHEMVQLLLFHCYFIIASLDPRLNLLFFSLQREELLSKRILAVIFFMWPEYLPITCNSLFIDFPCWVINKKWFNIDCYCPWKWTKHN